MSTSGKQAEGAAQFLTTLRHQLQNRDSRDAQKWLEDISELQASFTKRSTILGIIGATGAGKSALINALLDEERVLPTSCMRACTAVVTEISYNDSDVPYKAEIEFVSKSQWRAELEILFGDLLDGSGKIVRDSGREDTEAGVAYAKIKSVYPNLTREMLAQSTIDDLMAHPSVSQLGTTKNIISGVAADFYKDLQVYIDSREKIDIRLKTPRSADRVLEYWPLIRVVRLYLKSHILKSGAVLVDLPGVHDSNAARAAVAQTYLKQCSGLLIVAPITRAVDDKSAKTLLGQSFKQQLKLDGTFGNITFVCSKTDDILDAEAQDSLDLSEQLDHLRQRDLELETAMNAIVEEHQNLESSMEAANIKIEMADAEISAYQPLLIRAAQGFKISKPTSLKRKRPLKSGPGRNKRSIQSFFTLDSEGDDEDEDDSGSNGTGDEPLLDVEHTHDSLAKADIEHKVAELQETKAKARQECIASSQESKIKVKEYKALKKELATVQNQVSRVCILARNEYSRTAIREDFAAGVREIDEELAIENDPDNFNPHEELRDYDEVAQSLPVFCVSSRGYQRLCGRNEKKTSGFETKEDTEVPQLQAHCRQVAEDLRTASNEAFILRVGRLCISFRIWASSHDHQHSLTGEQRLLMEGAIKADLQQFSDDLLRNSKDAVAVFEREIKAEINSRFQQAIDKAQQKATNTVGRWNMPVNRDNRAQSGIFHTTYGAIVRRHGCFPKQNIVHDFNRELASPLISKLSHAWEKVFLNSASAIFDNMSNRCEESIVSFRSTITATALRHGIPAESIDLLEQQLEAQTQEIREAVVHAKFSIQASQKDVNREFIPLIAREMSDIYDECAAEHGTGMHARMKRIMEQGIVGSSGSMFQACIASIDEQLKKMIISTDSELRKRFNHITTWITRDYMRLCANKSERLLEEEKLLKEVIMSHVDQYESGQHNMEGVSRVQAQQVQEDVVKVEMDEDI